MDQSAVSRLALICAAFLATFAVALTVAGDPLAAQAPPRQAAAQRTPAKADKQAQPSPAEQTIAVLVNDEPITAYEIQQRTAFLAMQGGDGGGPDLKAKAESRWKEIVKDPKNNERLQALLRERNVKSQEEAQAVQKEFVVKLQQNMIEQLRREGRNAMLPKFRKEAQEELIEERLKLQEAKRLGIEISDDEVGRVIKSIAERNKMTAEQFTQHVKSAGGVEIATMRERLRAQFAWREVVRRRGQMLVSINERDVERMMSASASEAGQDTVELQVQKVTLLTPAPADQTAMARRYAEADALRRKFGGCNTMSGLAKEAAGARYEDLKYIKPSSIPEPTRSMLLSAKDGDMLPPATAGAGIEIYAVCGRRPIQTDAKVREKAMEELAQKEFDIVAKRYLRDLRQDAHIEFR
jgi:peptidyl-prolyl cis-trans isomerase SurA